MRIILFAVTAFVTHMIFTPFVWSQVYVEYSKEMVQVMKDSEAVDFVRQVVAEQNTVLYAGQTPGSGTSQQAQVGRKGADALIDCYGEDRLTGKCYAGYQLARAPDGRNSVNFKFIRSAGSSLSGVGALFTSYKGKMRDLREILAETSLPFHLLHQSTSAGNKLFYLSFLPVKDTRLLAGIQPFSRDAALPTCSASCDAGRRVNLLQKCFRGRYPGIIKGVQYVYPDKDILPEFIECPSGSFPPEPSLSDELLMRMPFSEEIYYKRLVNCVRSVKGREPPEPKSDSGIKLQIRMSVMRANPERFNALPGEVAEMLTSLAGETREKYLQPTQKTLTLTISNCR
ncbi:MAG: hypothetical protein HQK59_11700 [Deltaproteobacteria bacterium]|nr:hypothetical protein [Deltaproteobacteria bacterium]